MTSSGGSLFPLYTGFFFAEEQTATAADAALKAVTEVEDARDNTFSPDKEDIGDVDSATQTHRDAQGRGGGGGEGSTLRAFIRRV